MKIQNLKSQSVHLKNPVYNHRLLQYTSVVSYTCKHLFQVKNTNEINQHVHFFITNIIISNCIEHSGFWVTKNTYTQTR